MGVSGPLKAIRKYCLECCCGDATEVRQCTATGCSLHGARLGNHTYTAQSAIGEKPVKARRDNLALIKARCYDCSGFVDSAVRRCTETACSLYPYRKGKRNRNSQIDVTQSD